MNAPWRAPYEDTSPMKLSEKSLELNVGAELLGLLRGPWGMPKAYLRGLTQREEKQEGVDFFVQLDPETRVFAFQFKAPKGSVEATPYRYMVVREQHELLFNLSQLAPGAVFYVLPFYVTPAKLQQDVPQLVQDTWLLDVGQMPISPLFGPWKSRTIRCVAGQAYVNPGYRVRKLADIRKLRSKGIPVRSFARWYIRPREHANVPLRRRNPWVVRGLRVVIVPP